MFHVSRAAIAAPALVALSLLMWVEMSLRLVVRTVLWFFLGSRRSQRIMGGDESLFDRCLTIRWAGSLYRWIGILP